MARGANDFTDFRRWDEENFLHPWEMMADRGASGRTFNERAEGIYVYDENGERLIDGPGGMWCVQLGYGRQEIGQAMADQAAEMAYFSPYSHGNSTVSKLAHEIARRTPGDLNTVFFTTGGSTAVDSAIRFMHFRNNLLGRSEKKIVISRQKAYHGSTYLSASVSGNKAGPSPPLRVSPWHEPQSCRTMFTNAARRAGSGAASSACAVCAASSATPSKTSTCTHIDRPAPIVPLPNSQSGHLARRQPQRP